MIELEAKFRVEDHAAVLLQLERGGGAFVGRYIEHNVIFDRPDGSLVADGCGLRVRGMETLDGAVAPATITFKGPAQPSAFKRRTEIETSVGDFDRACALLEAVGFEVRLSYRKRRERWVMEGCHVELDRVPMIGDFVEIEGLDEPKIGSVRKRLGLGGAEHVRSSYVRMLADACRCAKRSPMGIDFD